MRRPTLPLVANLALFVGAFSFGCADLTAPASHSMAAAQPSATAGEPDARTGADPRPGSERGARLSP